MILHTEMIKPLDGYRLLVHFDNGVIGEIDLTNELWGEIFKGLKDPKLFASARQSKSMRTVVWDNGADFAPEFLLDLLNKQLQEAA